MLLLLLFASLFSAPTQVQEEEIEQTNVEKATVMWADTTFAQHENYKFSYFKAFHTDEYLIHEMRINLYEEKINALDDLKAHGNYSGSEEDYLAKRKVLVEALENAKKTPEHLERISYYTTNFWTNIKTKDGITVYYELIIKLDHNYQVIEAKENSSIGKKMGKSKILYASTPNLIKVIEK